MATVLFNGAFLPKEQAVVDIEDRGYQFGDGIYEVVGVYGGKPFKMGEHMARFVRSANEIGLEIPYPASEISSKLLKLLELEPVHDGLIYFQATRGTAPRGHAFPQPSVPANFIAYTKPVIRPIELQRQGVKCITAEDIRWLRCDIKSLNLLGNVLAKQQAADCGTYEAILHREDTVTEGSSTNAFIVNDRTVYTHPATNLILSGITRMTVKDICAEIGVMFEERPFRTAELLAADEAFISGTTIDVVPVIEVDGIAIGRGVPGPVTTAIQFAFQRRLTNS